MASFQFLFVSCINLSVTEIKVLLTVVARSVRTLISSRSLVSSLISTMVLSFVSARPPCSGQNSVMNMFCRVICRTFKVATLTVSENVSVRISEVKLKSKAKSSGLVVSFTNAITCRAAVSLIATTGLEFMSSMVSIVIER